MTEWNENALPVSEHSGEEKDTAPSSGRGRRKIPPSAEFLIRVGLTIAVLWLLLTFVFGVYLCRSDACSPNVKDGDLCVTWKPGEPEKGDLIVWTREGETGFARVVALPGDAVDLRDGVVTVNGFAALKEPLPSDFATDSVKLPYEVPEDSFFVICDNLQCARDDSLFGAMKLSDCRGSVVFLLRRRGF